MKLKLFLGLCTGAALGLLLAQDPAPVVKQPPINSIDIPADMYTAYTEAKAFNEQAKQTAADAQGALRFTISRIVNFCHNNGNLIPSADGKSCISSSATMPEANTKGAPTPSASSTKAKENNK
jgi:hypothetical protein